MAGSGSKVIKNFIYNTAYELLRLLAPLITAPYVSRVLGADGVGAFSYTQSIATYFVLMGAVGTTLYGQREIAFLQHDVQRRTDAFWQIVGFRFLTSVLCMAVFWSVFCRAGKYVAIYRVLAMEVAATAFDISWFFMGMEDFRTTVIRNALIKLSGIVLVFLLVKKPEDVPLYALCMTLPIFLGSISFWTAVRKHLGKPSKSVFNGIPRQIKPIFILFVPQVAIDVYVVLDKTMIGLLSPAISEVGYYTQAQKIIKVVLVFLTSLGTVMLPAMSAAFAQGRDNYIRRSIQRAFRFVFMLSVALIFGICAVSDRFVPLFFGNGFEPVSLLMIVISPILLLIGISNVIGKQYLLPTKQQKAFTTSVVTGAAVNICLNALLIPRYNAAGASVATVIAEFSVTLVQLLFVREQLPLKKYFLPLFRYLPMGVVMCLAVRALSKFLPQGSIPVLILLVAAGTAVYVGELLLTRDEMLFYGINHMKKKLGKV